MESIADESTPAQAEPRRRWSSFVWIALAIAGGALVLGTVLAGVTLLRARDDMQAGRRSLLEGRRAIVSGRLEDAAGAFGEAERSFDRAVDATSGPVAWMGGLTPMFGNNVRATHALAEGGGDLAGTGADLAEALLALPAGIDSLAPSRGGLPLDTYGSLAGELDSAATRIEASSDAIHAAPSAFLLPSVRDAVWVAQRGVDELRSSVEGGRALLEALPTFAGGDGTRRYLVLAQNPAEVRGTGGLWGAFAVLSLRDGVPSLSDAAPTQSLPDLTVDQIEGVSEDYRLNYDPFGGAASWQNMNMTPDFPSAAAAAIANYETGTGRSLDGVIAADPFSLAAMMRVTGPAEVPGTGITVSAADIVAFATNEAFSVLPRPAERKEVLGELTASVLARFLGSEGAGIEGLRSLGDAVGGGHLLVYSDDPEVQEAFEGLGVAGGFLSLASGSTGDFAALTLNNGSANKVDFFARTHVSYDVVLEPGGAEMATLTTEMENAAPTSGLPRYVLGPFVEGLEPGDARPLVTGWCHTPCDLLESTWNGSPVSVTSGTEGGQRWFRHQGTIAAGDGATHSLVWRSQGTWEGDTSSGSYGLRFSGPASIEPVELEVSVRLPPDESVIWSNLPVVEEDGRVVWRGTSRPGLELQIRFQAPTATRWWRNVSRAFAGI